MPENRIFFRRTEELPKTLLLYKINQMGPHPECFIELQLLENTKSNKPPRLEDEMLAF